MTKKIEKLTESIAHQMAAELRPFYFKNGNLRKMKSADLEIAWRESPAVLKYARLCKVATKCGDWENNGDFSRFFNKAFKKALKNGKV